MNDYFQAIIITEHFILSRAFSLPSYNFPNCLMCAVSEMLRSHAVNGKGNNAFIFTASKSRPG